MEKQNIVMLGLSTEMQSRNNSIPRCTPRIAIKLPTWIEAIQVAKEAMASLQLKEPVHESVLPVADCQHDESTTAQKHQEADAKPIETVKSGEHLTEFYSHESESLQHGKHTIATGKTKEKGKKESNKELYAATCNSANMVALKPMKAEHKVKEEKTKKEEEKKKKKSKSKSKGKGKDSSSSSESEDDVCSKKKGGKEKKHK